MIAVIPTCGESPHLWPLLEELDGHCDATVMINNCDEATFDYIARRVESYSYHTWEHHRGQMNIYSLWNLGIDAGRKQGCHVAVLNDDVWLDHRTLLPISQILDSTNRAIAGWDWVHTDQYQLDRVQHVKGTYRRGGIGGFAFAVNPKLVQPIDERFQWWGGDDDLVYQTKRNGYQVVLAVGLGVVHHTSTSTQVRPVPSEVIAADRQLMLDKWGEAW